jgi:hypothetical protein
MIIKKKVIERKWKREKNWQGEKKKKKKETEN